MGVKEWYFFSLKDRKYPTGLRTNRATEAGYWKTTGKDKEIFSGGGVLVGMKKTLVFYRGMAPNGSKTNWVMHEYRLETKHGFKPTKEEWIVCRVFQKSSATKKSQPSSSSPQSPSYDTTTFANEFEDIHDLQNLPNISALQNNYYNYLSTTLPLLSWPPALLSSNLSSVNSLLFRALQFRTNQQLRDHQSSIISTCDYSNNVAQGSDDIILTQFRNDDLIGCSRFAPTTITSSSVVLDSVN